jgi:hypothetical protein
MKNITLTEALDLERSKKIMICNPNTVITALSTYSSWALNFDLFKEENSQVPLSKLWSIFDYRIETKTMREDIVYWTYMYGKNIN